MTAISASGSVTVFFPTCPAPATAGAFEDENLSFSSCSTARSIIHASLPDAAGSDCNQAPFFIGSNFSNEISASTLVLNAVVVAYSISVIQSAVSFRHMYVICHPEEQIQRKADDTGFFFCILPDILKRHLKAGLWLIF